MIFGENFSPGMERGQDSWGFMGSAKSSFYYTGAHGNRFNAIDYWKDRLTRYKIVSVDFCGRGQNPKLLSKQAWAIKRGNKARR